MARDRGQEDRAQANLLSQVDFLGLALDPAGVHEIKPAARDWSASWSAALSFSLALMARRLAGFGEGCTNSARGAHPGRPLLWCLPRAARAEHGVPCIQGWQRFGLTPGNVIVVETGSDAETLWVLEEGLRSDDLVLVAGLIGDVALTPARRLTLAAQKHRTPCLLLTHPRTSPAAATATRWRIAAAPSTPQVSGLTGPASRSVSQSMSSQFMSLRRPGARRFAVSLERCRARPGALGRVDSILEWCDEALCFRLAAGVCDSSYAPLRARIGAA